MRWFVVWPQDLKITKRAVELSNTSSEIYEIYDNHLEFLRLVRNLNYFVGMKLHATILATCAFVPSLMLEYRPKCRDYMRSIDQEDATVRTDQFDAGSVWEKVLFNSTHRDQISKRIHRFQFAFNSQTLH